MKSLDKTSVVVTKSSSKAAPEVLWVYCNETRYFPKPGLVFCFPTPYWNSHFTIGVSRAVFPGPVDLLLGPLYNRSRGPCSTQITHSYWCKSWNQPWVRNYCTLGVKAQKEMDLFNLLPQVTNKCWTLWPCVGPKAEEKDTIKFVSLKTQTKICYVF